VLGSDDQEAGLRRPELAYALRDRGLSDPPRSRVGSVWGRPRNRRVAFQRREAVVVVWEALAVVGRRLLVALRVLSKAALALAVIVAVVWGGRLAIQHVIVSPRFQLRAVEVTVGGGATPARITREEVLELAGVAEGDHLLQIDTDAVAATLARHPWVARVRVRRQLPAALVIEVTERRAVAAAALGALYLIDERGHPFKRATMEEADGLAVVTGIARAQYAAKAEVAEAAFREALALLDEYRSRPERPAISEVNLDGRFGMTLFLRDGGAEIRLGRGDTGKKLARFDQIFEAVKADGPAASLRVVHLDRPGGAGGAQVPVRLAEDRKKD
jgi:cell division protein FtsQ